MKFHLKMAAATMALATAGMASAATTEFPPPTEHDHEAHEAKPEAAADHSAMDHGAAEPADMDHAAMGHEAMRGALGPYPMAREASGTAWQPDSSQHGGLMRQSGDWTLMAHGNFDLIADHQGGRR